MTSIIGHVGSEPAERIGCAARSSSTEVALVRQHFSRAKAVLHVLMLLSLVAAARGKDVLWLSAGQNQDNTRFNAEEHKLSPKNVARLGVKWVFTTAGDVSATPAVDDTQVYFPDWAGKLYAVDRKTGKAVWTKSVADYTGVSNSFARATPVVAGDLLVFGTQLDASKKGAQLIGVDKNTGALRWITRLDNHPAAIITQSAIVFENHVYVGVASAEEGFASDPSYPCCSFRGSMLALNLADGSIIWKTFITPENKGFSGGAVWGSTPVIDVKRHSLYIGTGNNYTVPQALLDCVQASGTPDQVRACVAAIDGSADNHFDAVMALDPDTGAIKWSNTVIPFDAWTVGCLFAPNPNCPEPAGPDYDFGQGPALFTVRQTDGASRELLGAGQKSGIYWVLDPDTGAVVWGTQVGPGGTLGGLEFGSAVDGQRIYTAVANTRFLPVTLSVGLQAGTTVKGGYWSALDAATGQVLWQTAANQPPAKPSATTPPDAIAINPGAVTAANGVVFAGALDAVGTMYAMDAATGKILWSFASGGSVNSGAAIVDGVVYWGSGYAHIQGTPNRRFYAFEVKGNGKGNGGNKGNGKDH